MCGKFTMMMSWRQVHDLSDLAVRADSAAQGPGDDIAIGTPMRMIPVIHLDENGNRTVTPMRWGFAERRAKSPLERPGHMHARAETVDTLPTFTDAFAFSRGIIIARTFNVGQDMPDGRVVQHTLTPRDGQPFGLGVIWERWADRSERSLMTFVMVTTPANSVIARVTDRMPAIIDPEYWPLWLGETKQPLAAVKAILLPHKAGWDIAEQPQPAKKKAQAARPTGRSDEQPDLF